MPVNERLDELAAVELVIPVRVVHLEVVELQLLLGHVAGVDRDVHVLLHVPAKLDVWIIAAALGGVL